MVFKYIHSRRLAPGAAVLGGLLAAGVAQAQAVTSADGYTINHELSIVGGNGQDSDLPGYDSGAPFILSPVVINDNGVLAGQQQPQTGTYSGETIGFVGTTSITYSSNVSITGINSSGDIVGVSNGSAFYATPSDYTSAAPTQTLADPNSYGGSLHNTAPVGISDTGIVVGNNDGQDGANHAFSYLFEYSVAGNSFTDVAYPSSGDFAGNSGFQATAISGNGEFIAGDFTNAANIGEGFVYNTSTGVWSDFSDANAVSGINVTGVNNSGEVAGWYSDNNLNANNGYDVGFVYNAVSGAFVADEIQDPANFSPANINAQGVPGSGTMVTGINDSGELAGVISGYQFAFTAEPSSFALPLPGSAWLMGGALAGLGALPRRKPTPVYLPRLD